MSGRLPFREYRKAQILAPDTGSGATLVLQRRADTMVEKIYLDQDGHEVKAIEMFDNRGFFTYRADFVSYYRINGYNLPSELIITDLHGLKLVLKAEQVWTGMPLADEVFVLAPPAVPKDANDG
jgi:hypothetical protein